MTELLIPKLASLTDRQLSDSLAAIDEIRECYRVLEKGGLNVVGEVLKGQGPFHEMDHYPKEDVYDRETASQYYCHAHREDHADPSWPVNRWLTAMVRCFRPQIEALLYHRDEVIYQREAQALELVLEDRSLEITGTVPIDVESWAELLETEQKRRTGSNSPHMSVQAG